MDSSESTNQRISHRLALIDEVISLLVTEIGSQKKRRSSR
jgi:hypothetical protein